MHNIQAFYTINHLYLFFFPGDAPAELDGRIVEGGGWGQALDGAGGVAQLKVTFQSS